MAEWIYFIHPPREDFAATMTDAESEAWGRHWALAKRRFEDGNVVLMGPTLGRDNTGICVFEAEDEAAARAYMAADPAIAEGFARGELRPFRVSLLRGRPLGR
ncbi:MAG TPA: YciI family protein [Candidatus Limnocylindrales bacterium]